MQNSAVGGTVEDPRRHRKTLPGKTRTEARTGARGRREAGKTKGGEALPRRLPARRAAGGRRSVPGGRRRRSAVPTQPETALVTLPTDQQSLTEAPSSNDSAAARAVVRSASRSLPTIIARPNGQERMQAVASEVSQLATDMTALLYDNSQPIVRVNCTEDRIEEIASEHECTYRPRNYGLALDTLPQVNAVAVQALFGRFIQVIERAADIYPNAAESLNNANKVITLSLEGRDPCQAVPETHMLGSASRIMTALTQALGGGPVAGGQLDLKVRPLVIIPSIPGLLPEPLTLADFAVDYVPDPPRISPPIVLTKAYIEGRASPDKVTAMLGLVSAFGRMVQIARKPEFADLGYVKLIQRQLRMIEPENYLWKVQNSVHRLSARECSFVQALLVACGATHLVRALQIYRNGVHRAYPFF